MSIFCTRYKGSSDTQPPNTKICLNLTLGLGWVVGYGLVWLDVQWELGVLGQGGSDLHFFAPMKVLYGTRFGSNIYFLSRKGCLNLCLPRTCVSMPKWFVAREVHANAILTNAQNTYFLWSLPQDLFRSWREPQGRSQVCLDLGQFSNFCRVFLCLEFSPVNPVDPLLIKKKTIYRSVRARFKLVFNKEPG